MHQSKDIKDGVCASRILVFILTGFNKISEMFGSSSLFFFLQSSDGENRVRASKDEVSSSSGASSNPRPGFHPHIPSDPGATAEADSDIEMTLF